MFHMFIKDHYCVCAVVFPLVPLFVTANFAAVKDLQERGSCSHPDVAGWSGE